MSSAEGEVNPNLFAAPFLNKLVPIKGEVRVPFIINTVP
jgi:hypothetical protein